MRIFRFNVIIIALLAVFGLPARGEVFHVGVTDDTTNIDSLRGAIIAANTRGGDNTIVLNQSVYHLTIPGADETNSYAGDLDITRGDLAIVGVGSLSSTIDATGLGDRVFRISPGARLTLENLVIKGGASPAGVAINIGTLQPNYQPGNGENGGGIYNAGDLAIDHCTVTGNLSGVGSTIFGIVDPSGSGGNGGGIYNVGNMVLEDSVVSDNSCGAAGTGSLGSGGNGGGICNYGTMQLENCNVSYNSAGSATYAMVAGGGGNGGGIYNAVALEMTKCNIFNNISGNGGSTINSGTIRGTSGGNGGGGGGIYNFGVLSMQSCYISENIAGIGGNSVDYVGGSGGSGGGVYNSGILSLHNSIFRRNIAGNGGNSGYNYILGFSQPTIGSGYTGGNGGSGGGVFNAGDASDADLIGTMLGSDLAGLGGLGGIPPSGKSGTDGPAGPAGSGPDLSGSFTVSIR